MKKIAATWVVIMVCITSIPLVNAASQAEEASKIIKVWNSFVNNLKSKEIDAALEHVAEERREGFREGFYLIIDKLPGQFSKREEFQIKEINEYIAEGENIVYENDSVYSYPIMLIKDENGEWKIQSF